MRHTIARTLAATLILALAGCQSTPTREQTGAVLGGATGGLLGAQIGSGTGQLAATAAGTLLGYMVGSSIGRTMDEVDRMRVARTLESTPTGRSRSWQNPDTGNQYTVTPTRTYERGPGPCREYTLDASVGGDREQVYGTACRQADGSWKVQS